MRDTGLLTDLLLECDHFVAGAALIGGISYFHAYAYDLLAANERIMAVVLRRRHLAAHRDGRLQKVTLRQLVDGVRVDRGVAVGRGLRAAHPAAAVVLRLPEARGRVLRPGGLGPVPAAVHDRPAVQLRRRRRGRALGDVEVRSGNVKLAMSHVVPDLVQKVLKGQDPLHILGDGDAGPALHLRRRPRPRHRDAPWSTPQPLNEDFNLSTAEGTTVAELAEVIWRKIKGPGVPLTLVADPAFEYDVRRRMPSTEKAERVLGFTATTTLEEMLDEVMPWIEKALVEGVI